MTTAEHGRERSVKRKTVAILTAEAIRTRILTGRYREGMRLRQDGVAADLGVSRTPVREALRHLEAEGLVETCPAAGGAVVSTLSLRDIRGLFEMRALVEGDLVRRAAANARAEDVGRAARLLAQFESGPSAGDADAWAAMNWRFHRALYAPAKRGLTLDIVHGLNQNSDRYLRMQLAVAGWVPHAMEEHRAILGAVGDGDGGHAAALLAAHILGAGHTLVSFLARERGECATESSLEARRRN